MAITTFKNWALVGALAATASLHAVEAGRYMVSIRNDAYRQPLSRFFVAVHNEQAEPVFRLGEHASPALATLAEDGNPDELVDLYTNEQSHGILTAAALGDGLIQVGEELSFVVETQSDMAYMSFVSMAVNTNDCFVGANAIMLEDNLSLRLPGYDAGSEENNELCTSIPGPACAEVTGNVRSGNGEGVIHVHRGVHGIADLGASVYDWRNPMIAVTVEVIA